MSSDTVGGGTGHEGGASDADPKADAGGPQLTLIHGGKERLTPDQQKLVLRVRWLVQREAYELAPWASHELRADLMTEGMLAATEVVHSYDPSIGRFSSYALPRIRGAIADQLSKELQHRRLVRAARAAGRALLAEEPDTFRVDLEDDAVNQEQLDKLAGRLVASMLVGMASASSGPEEALAERESHERAMAVVRRALLWLSKDDRQIVALRFMEHRMQREIAAELGIDERTVRRRLADMLAMLRTLLIEHGITEAPR